MGEREILFLIPVQKGDAICRAVDSHKACSSVEFVGFNFNGTKDFYNIYFLRLYMSQIYGKAQE